MKPGPTNTFSEGKINEEDEGDLNIAICWDPEHEIVRINFGIPVEWIGFGPANAIEFANAILMKVPTERKQ